MFYSFSLYIKVGTSLAAPEETQETWIPSLVGEDPLKEEMATHSSILAWEVLWTEEPGYYCPWGRKDRDTTGAK